MKLTEKQVADIVTAIQRIFDLVREDAEKIDEHLDEDFKKGRKEQTNTRIVYSAFLPGEKIVEGFSIRKEFYGNGLCLPELYNEDAVIQLYNWTASFRTNEVAQKIRLYGDKFACLKFLINDDYKLTRIELVRFSGLNLKGKPIILTNESIYVM